MADKVVEVELTLKLRVTVTDEVRQGVQEGLVDGFTGKPVNLSDEQIARRMAYASLNPRLSGWECENASSHDYWDGVCDMNGLLNGYELDFEDPEGERSNVE